MRRILVGLAVVNVIAFSGMAMAGEKLTKDEVTSLITDTTYAAKNPMRGTVTNGTILADGSLSATSSDGTFETGTWKVTEEGEYCTNWSGRWKSGCGPFEKTDDPNVFSRSLNNSSPALFNFNKR
ncbi:hypothetical protein [Magnetospirillum sulfuroxidans]|uniref:Uncharacterized protein n=1 Tax=Magnetospirillum sulfuroxidans TaxID=611300 RepID=A0ABS5I829_9PROT|nr:hypothetical protein [Magnetospirillum sulfuroxidans]MBR9970581.1 hypothetical protein [Magnetospirillum sulfuroxidans]